jgi:hypothetical protein
MFILGSCALYSLSCAVAVHVIFLAPHSAALSNTLPALSTHLVALLISHLAPPASESVPHNNLSGIHVTLCTKFLVI